MLPTMINTIKDIRLMPTKTLKQQINDIEKQLEKLLKEIKLINKSL